MTTLGPVDHYNGRGTELAHAAGVIRQDRFRVHTERPDPGDELDPVYGDEKERAKLESRLKDALSPDVAKTILERNPKIKVAVFEDRIDVAILDPGTDEAACIITTTKLANIPLGSPADGSKLPPRMRARGWKVVTTGGEGEAELRDSSGNAVASMGLQLAATGAVCQTTHGIRIGSTLKQASKDTDFKPNGCVCGGSGDSTLTPMVLSEMDPDTHSVIYLQASCQRPMGCGEDETAPPCTGRWDRDDCVVTGISVGPAPGI